MSGAYSAAAPGRGPDGIERMPEFHLNADHIASVVEDMIVEVRCGLHPWERHPERPNRLAITVKTYARLGGRRGAMPVMDYDRIREFVRSFEKRPHIDLLETIVEDIVSECFADQRVEACHVSVRKPDIFPEARGAGIEVFRTRAAWDGAA